MKIFVASWFFFPGASSAGIGVYKQLKNSRHEYDVFCSSIQQEAYKAGMDFKEDSNIRSFSLQTDSVETWVEWCISQFSERNQREQYTCIMTVSAPPESILIGKMIKEKYPDIKWIADLANPIGNNPYDLSESVDEDVNLPDSVKRDLKEALRSDNKELIQGWGQSSNEAVNRLCRVRSWELDVLKKADLVISPTARQLNYINEEKTYEWNYRFFTLPWSFDDSFYQNEVKEENDKIVLSYVGSLDRLRSLGLIIQALNYMKQERDPALDRIEFHIIGKYPRVIKDMVLNYYLDDYILFYDEVDYLKSLKLMCESDWLVHIDVNYPDIVPGGSVFFAEKLADYMGAKKPILGITGRGTPACGIITSFGGICVEPDDREKIIRLLEKISEGYVPELDLNYRKRYDAREVAAVFDRKVDELCDTESVPLRKRWPSVDRTEKEKLLSVCVPSFNVQSCLDRCLYTLLEHEMAAYMEILIINDGSSDGTAKIGKAYQDHYPGIVRLISKENGGHGSAINTAIREAKGLYFKNVDGDDWVDSKALESLIRQIRDKELFADVISSCYHEVDADTSKLTFIGQETRVNYGKEYTISELPLDKIYISMHSMTVKTKILKEMNVWLQEHTYYVDVEYILFPVPYIETVAFTGDCIYKYSRGSDEQSVAIPNMIKRYDQHARVLKRVISYGEETEMGICQKTYYDEIVKRVIYSNYLLTLFYDKDIERGCERTREFDEFLYSKRPDLAEWIGQKMDLLRAARRCEYSPEIYRKYAVRINEGEKPEDIFAAEQAAKEAEAAKAAGSQTTLSIIARKISNSLIVVRTVQNSIFVKERKKGRKNR